MDFGWEWKEEEKKWIPIMTTLLPAPDAIIHLLSENVSRKSAPPNAVSAGRLD